MKALPVATLLERILLFVALFRHVCLERSTEMVLLGLAAPE